MVPGLKQAGVEFISDPVALDAGPNSGGWALYLKDPNGIVAGTVSADNSVKTQTGDGSLHENP